MLALKVRDYGHGLPREQSPDGNGLRGMRERAGLIGARIELGPPPQGPGTELLLEVPLAGTP
jgi:two-component system sensor histidine kinase UhpB